MWFSAIVFIVGILVCVCLCYYIGNKIRSFTVTTPEVAPVPIFVAVVAANKLDLYHTLHSLVSRCTNVSKLRIAMTTVTPASRKELQAFIVDRVIPIEHRSQTNLFCHSRYMNYQMAQRRLHKRFNNRSYYLVVGPDVGQIPKKWDHVFTEQLDLCGGAHPILTAPATHLNGIPAFFTVGSSKTGFVIGHRPFKEQRFKTPQPSAICSSHFMFCGPADADILGDLWDPHLFQLSGSDCFWSAKLWTHGFSFYISSKFGINFSQRQPYIDQASSTDIHDTVRQMECTLGLRKPESIHPRLRWNLGKRTLGRVYGLEEFESYAGFAFMDHYVSGRAKLGLVNARSHKEIRLKYGSKKELLNMKKS